MIILLYHGVRPQNDLQSPDIRGKHIPEALFRRQMAFLKQTHTLFSLSDVVAGLRQGRSFPALSACITFDDGYANNAETAAPILRELGIPATFFITTGFIDGTTAMWVDRVEAAMARLTASMSVPQRAAKDNAFREELKRLPPAEREEKLRALEQEAGSGAMPELFRAMTWAQVQELAREGFEIGAHTLTHPILSRCEDDRAREEIVGSKKRIEEKLGGSCKHFAHPNGQAADWNETTVKFVKEAGFESCATTIAKRLPKQADMFHLPRLTIDARMEIPRFALTVSGIRPMLQGLKHRFSPTL